MSSQPPLTNSKLCPFCRRLTPLSHTCPSAQPTRRRPNPVTPLAPHEESLFLTLQSQLSTLCKRCKAYDLPGVFANVRPLDRLQQMNNMPTSEQHIAYHGALAPYRMELGVLSELVLSPGCPLCRLVFRILPREGLVPDDDTLMIVPFRSHIRQAWWAVAEDGFKERSAVMLGVDYAGSAMSLGRGVLGMAAEMSPEMEGEAICIEDGGVERKSLGNGRFVGRMVDWEMVKMALQGRINGHGRECLVEKEEQIKYARMIDVEERKVVPCAVGCEYFALSYVWGGVMPEEGALRKGTLPRTIEDAIETTRKMGRRYLWVDALCIDQRPNPTPEQRAEKERQLRIMDMIYSSATLTLVAVAGKDSKAGLPGVNSARPRTIQVRETIGGRTFFTVPPTSTQERNSSLWSTRAWTLQEELLSRRYLFFSDTHVEFICGSSRVPESLDTKTLSDWGSLVPNSLNQLFLRRDEKTLSDVDDGDRGLSMNLFWGIIINYTSRRMTNDGDSLNAILGLLVRGRVRWIPLLGD